MVTYTECQLAYEKQFKSVPFQELDNAFYVAEYFASKKEVPPYMGGLIIRRISDYYQSWASFFHRLLMPNPSSIIDLEESKNLTTEDKKNIQRLLRDVMGFVTKATALNFEKDVTENEKFMKESLDFYSTALSPFLKEFLLRLHESWKKDSIKDPISKSYGGII